MSNLERRGAIYYWRKRMPPAIRVRLGLAFVRVSLQTPVARTARFLGSQMSASAEDIFMTSDLQSITKTQLTELFREAFKRQCEKLVIVAAFSREDADYDPQVEIAEEVRMGWAYSAVAQHGPHVKISDKHHPDMRRGGLSQSQIEEVAALLERWKQTHEGEPSIAKLIELVEGVGARSSAGNIAKATPVYLRALGEALLQAKSRYLDEPLPFDDLVAGIVAPAPAAPLAPAPLLEPETVVSARKDTTAFHDAAKQAVFKPGTAKRTSRAAKRAAPRDDAIATIGQRLIAENLRDKTWEAKTARQAAATFSLFERCLKEVHGVVAFGDVRQEHLDSFGTLMRDLSPSYGKGPADRTKPIAQLRAAGAALPEDKRGLAGGTRNRHLTFVGQLLRRAKAAGARIDPDLRPSDLRAKKSKRGRDERTIPSKDAVAGLFHLPVFTGCAGWDRMHEPGDQVFHRAAYFGPLLAHYQGMRREEYCGLAIEDVVRIHEELPYLHVAPNKFRRIKNIQSSRNLVLHPELVRLGFLDYVHALRSVGHERVFPDLYSASTRSPLGDRYYDELRPAFQNLGITPHQSRHFFGNSLKQVQVQAEHRADLLGHGGHSETTERYCNSLELKLQLKAINQLLNISGHLRSISIKLVPWVAEHKPAPWARRK